MMAGLVNHLWQSTLFAVGACLLTLAFRRNRARVRYWVWFSASVKFLIPFALLAGFGHQLPPIPRPLVVAAPSIAIVELAQPFPDVSSVAPAQRGSAWPVALIAIWMCGFTAVLLIRVRAWLRLRAICRDGYSPSRPAFEAGAPPVVYVPDLLEPGVIGIIRPKLLLPAGIEARLTVEQLRAVVAHELCHIRCRDNLTSAIHIIVEGLFWFHPLVWWVGARLVQERERACDEEVLQLGNSPDVYAEGIMQICKSYFESPLQCVSGVAGGDLKSRIHAILGGRPARDLNFVKKAALAAAILAALLAPILIGILNVPPGRAQSKVAGPTFDAASIKVSDPSSPAPGRLGNHVATGPGMVTGKKASLKELAAAAYELETYQVVGGPSWTTSAQFDVQAKANASANSNDLHLMLRTLLTDRFRLAVHRETRQMDVYAMVLAKGVSKLRPAKPLGDGPRPTNHLAYRDLPSLAHFLTRLGGDMPVVDKTGLTGEFELDVDMQKVVEETATAADPTHKEMFDATANALEEQFGLKLTPSKAPIEVLVIDRVERPSAN